MYLYFFFIGNGEPTTNGEKQLVVLVIAGFHRRPENNSWNADHSEKPIIIPKLNEFAAPYLLAEYTKSLTTDNVEIFVSFFF